MNLFCKPLAMWNFSIFRLIMIFVQLFLYPRNLKRFVEGHDIKHSQPCICLIQITTFCLLFLSLFPFNKKFRKSLSIAVIEQCSTTTCWTLSFLLTKDFLNYNIKVNSPIYFPRCQYNQTFEDQFYWSRRRRRLIVIFVISKFYGIF